MNNSKEKCKMYKKMSISYSVRRKKYETLSQKNKFYFIFIIFVYSPREIHTFLRSSDLRNVLGRRFHKRHMESKEIQSPFDTPEEIFLLEYLISKGYLIAEYRNDDHKDSESYLISTMGHAFIEYYKKS